MVMKGEKSTEYRKLNMKCTIADSLTFPEQFLSSLFKE
jgi:hypothetical protein